MPIANRSLFKIILTALFLITLFHVRYASASLTVSATDINLTVGTSLTFTITGGTGFYKITSSSDTVATASMGGSSGDQGTIQGVALGAATITIEDSSGATSTINVLVSVITLSKTSVTFLPLESETVTVLTGSPDYNVATSDDTVATASVSNDIVTIIGVAAGTAIITVSDSNSDSTTITVIVGSSFSVDPSSVTISSGETANATISDNTGFYTVSSSDPSIATVSISGTTVVITGVSQGSATITVQNSAGFTSAISVTVDLSLFVKVELGLTESEIVSLAGGSGFYQVNIADASIATVSLVGDNATITGLGAGKTMITIEDNQANKFEFEVTVQLPAPVLNVSVTGTLAKLWWGNVANAGSYLLFYAPADAAGDVDTSNIGQVNVGSLESLIFDLKSGDHYFAAVQTIHGTYADVSSLVSNIEEIIIP
ncbi:MAG: hypothetical protein KKD21_12475 [Proteobacteria bacterium]|nr:hypothetical protein [Pseudomonadota bacterium]